MPILIEDKIVSSARSFVALSFAYYYYSSRYQLYCYYYYYIRFYFDLNFLFYSQALREYLVPGDFYFFFCFFVLYMFVIEKKTFRRQPHRMVNDTQTICRQIADEFFECV